MTHLVLSLFPGIGLLDRAFEEEGFCIVRGPDALWGGDIRTFAPPAGKFDGVIGGPPCKRFSTLANINRARYGEECLAPDLIPEFVRCVEAARPDFFLMENVERAPRPDAEGFIVHDALLNNRWCGGVQNRLRRFSFGTRDGRRLAIETHVFVPIEFEPTVTSNSGGRRAKPAVTASGRVVGKQGSADWQRLQRRPIDKIAALQGLPADFLADAPFTIEGKRAVIGNGVPLPMGRAIARAVKMALESGRRAA